ncbi:DivIVA domain-containing protein [Micromonospora sp. WMMD882]|uniref:DivIVA domain-containing protein n=1 Tax=Micromonospora sp. WMMD882 TaxID=3015151 RepID=UPI00248AC5D4|nr:DivIVA domain-containing protein [Micromonospora sp. WMMD882]WBB77887.1 DivIVA domain-containing protein [Micromonospora sp. WMMD882]
MRALLRRLQGRHRPRPPATDDTWYPPLSPERIRTRRFTPRRRGVDPDEIAAFLGRVADELAVAQTALDAVREENARIKNALRDWQSHHSARRWELVR